MNLESKIEAILFVKGEPQSVKSLSNTLGAKEEDIKNASEKLAEDLSTSKRGIRLLIKDDSLMLSTAPEVSHIIEKIVKNEYDPKLSQAAVETLATVIYKGPISKAEIDYIRGVNSGFILRNLLVRGLIERSTNPSDKRTHLYKPSFDLMQFLGIEKIEDLPEYGEFDDRLEKALSEMEKEDEEITEEEFFQSKIVKHQPYNTVNFDEDDI